MIHLVNRIEGRRGPYTLEHKSYPFNVEWIRKIPYVKEVTYCFEEIYLRNMMLTSDDFRAVASQSQLRMLDCSGSKLDLGHIQQLKNLQQLAIVNASSTNLDDSAFEYILGLPAIKELDVSNTYVSSEAVRRARMANSELVIHWP